MSESAGSPRHVGVIGGGRMGAGIAHAWLITGRQVTVVEKGDLAAARERVVASVTRAVGRNPAIGEADDLLRGLRVVADLADIQAPELVIESVPESVDLKSQVLQAVEARLPDAVIATNTSAIPIDVLADRLQRPDRFIGLHFFNPVPSSNLIEVVVGSRTDASLVDQARAWGRILDKTAIVVKDSPGFASSRLGVLLALEAMRMVEDGVATAEDVDLAMTLGYKHPIGPLRTTDVVGLDVRLAIAQNLEKELGDRFRPPAILTRLVEEGRLGRKSGRGFYDWSDG